MKKETKISIFLEKFLNFIFWGSLLLTIFVVYSEISNNLINESVFIYIFKKIVRVGIILYIIYTLKIIINTINNGKPFITRNVNRFKLIGYLIFFIGIFNTVVNFPNASGSLLLGTPYGGIEMGVFNYIIFGSLALVLAEVFNHALKIKKENELTI